MRVSLTQECQLACAYCRGAGPVAPGGEPLTTEELLSLVGELVSICGIEKIRLTGGEPLLHPHVVEVATRLKRLPSVGYLGITTNGLRLPELAEDLRRAGVDGVNLSLDSLRPETYRRLTGGGSLKEALAGLEAARRYDWRVKVNTVLLDGENDGEVLDFVRLVEGTAVELRFIEVMPTADGGHAPGEGLVTSERVRAILEEAYQLQPLPRAPGSAARLFRARRDGCTATVGLISSITDRFCGDCNRLRLTAEGELVACLWAGVAADLRPYVRPRWHPDGLRRAVEEVVAAKPLRHEPTVVADMLRIGG